MPPLKWRPSEAHKLQARKLESDIERLKHLESVPGFKIFLDGIRQNLRDFKGTGDARHIVEAMRLFRYFMEVQRIHEKAQRKAGIASK